MALKFASFGFVNEENMDIQYGLVTIENIVMDFASGELITTFTAWKDAESRSLGVPPRRITQIVPIDYFNDPQIAPTVSDISEDVWAIVRTHPFVADFVGVRTGGTVEFKSLDQLGAQIIDIEE